MVLTRPVDAQGILRGLHDDILCQLWVCTSTLKDRLVALMPDKPDSEGKQHIPWWVIRGRQPLGLGIGA